MRLLAFIGVVLGAMVVSIIASVLGVADID
jgi:hypothetical protein